MTLWDPSGPRTPPKSICTHRHTRLKNFDQKITICVTTVHGTLFGPDGLLRSKTVLNMFFGPLTISYDAWMVSHTKVKKVVFALENWSQNDPRATFPLGFRGKIFKKFFGPKLHQKTLQVLAVTAPKSWTGICTH